MRQISQQLRALSALGRILSVVALFLLGTASVWAYPLKGTTAPPLDSLKLLQAPSGAKADWASLKGKVVVLEFWASWCSPCIANLPHLNQVVESLDPMKFQFISIDDEEQKDIEKFLAKKKMAGWVGVDTSGSVFAQYGIKSRPNAVIIDGNGKIVATTYPESLTAADLRAVAEGKEVAFKPAMEFVEGGATTPATAESDLPLFSIAVSKASPDAKSARAAHPPSGTDLLGHEADSLLASTLDPFSNRYVLKTSLPEDRFNLRVSFLDVPDTVVQSVTQQAVLSALRLRLQPKTITKPAYLLRATDAGKKLLSFSASSPRTKKGYWNGTFVLMNATMDDLAYVLATGLETPVIDETGIKGSYDARFKVSGEGVENLNAVLKETFGLELVPGNQEMPLTVLEVKKQEETKQ